MTTKISTLPTLATVTAATIVPVVESGATKKVTAAALATYITGTVVASSVSAATPTAAGVVYASTLDLSGNATTAVGYQALKVNAGSSNVSVGADSLRSNTSGARNVAVGYQGLTANISGNENTAVGGYALAALTVNNNNTAVGYTAGCNVTGSVNDAFGNAALYGASGSTGSYNSAFGQQSLYSLTSGNQNVAVGRSALYSLTNGSYNVAMGVQSMYGMTTSNWNTGIGYQALYSSTTAYGTNTAVGYQSLYSATDNSNTAVGYQAGYGITSGHNNVCIGKNAGNGAVVLAGGALNVIIGSGAYGSDPGDYYAIVIGYGCNGVGGDYVTLGKLNNRVYCHYDTNATWIQASDVRLKKNIESDSLGLSFINRLNPVTYQWKATNELERDNPQYNEENNKNTTTVMHGLIAQEVKAALEAEGVDTFGGWHIEPNGIQGISREMFISPLIKAVQELKALVEAQAVEIAALKAKVN